MVDYSFKSEPPENLVILDDIVVRIAITFLWNFEQGPIYSGMGEKYFILNFFPCSLGPDLPGSSQLKGSIPTEAAHDLRVKVAVRHCNLIESVRLTELLEIKT